MFQTGDNAEDAVTLHVEDAEICCNRTKLAKFSHYFNAMFSGNFIESHKDSVKIQEVKISAFNNILTFVNGASDFSIQYNELLDTLQSACMLQVDCVKEYCVKRLTNNFQIDNLLQIWLVTEQLDIHPLSEKAKCKALIEFKTIRDTSSIFPLDIQQLHLYLSNTLLHCDTELDIFETGMKWWYEHSKNKSQADDDEYETKCLLTILNCIDFTSVSKNDVTVMKCYPDIFDKPLFTEILGCLGTLIEDNNAQIPDHLEKYVTKLFHNRKKRYRSVLPCIVSRDVVYNTERSKRKKVCESTKHTKLYFFDEPQKLMIELIKTHFHDDSKCNGLLEGHQMLAYKENILLFGGEYEYGTSYWNKNVWMYSTIKEKWELITKMPRERRHFKTCIIKDKLFIIGGTGKFRVIQDNMFYYDFIEDSWSSIEFPDVFFDIKCCEFMNQLFLISGYLGNKFGYLYNIETKSWQRLDIIDVDKLIPDSFDNFLIYSSADKLYIKGNSLIELELEQTDLHVKNVETTTPLCSYKWSYFKNKDFLYIFSNIGTPCDNHCYCALTRYCISTKTTDLLLIFEQTFEHRWLLDCGCFGLVHYSVAKKSDCISNFVF